MHRLSCQISALKISTHKPHTSLMVMINCIDLHIRRAVYTQVTVKACGPLVSSYSSFFPFDFMHTLLKNWLIKLGSQTR